MNFRFGSILALVGAIKTFYMIRNPLIFKSTDISDLRIKRFGLDDDEEKSPDFHFYTTV